MSQQIGWSVESKLLYEIKQLTRQLSGRQYILTFPNFASFPTPGITGTLYVDESTGDIYVWNGTAYTLLSAGITALNGLIAAAQLLVIGSTGTDFNISSVGTTHTFNIPTASATNRGLLSSANWTTFNNKQNAITLTTTGTSGAATLVGSTLNIPQYQSVLTNPVTGTGTTNYIPKFTAASTIGNSQIFDNGTNVGIGITPGTTNLGKSLSLNYFGNGLFSYATDNVYLNSNTYYNGDWKYANSAAASQYVQFGGAHLWYTAPSGTANNNVTLTERLRITSGGDVGIGTASPTSKLDVLDGDISVNTLGTFSFFNTNRNTIPSGAGTSLGGLRYRAYTTGTTYQVGAQILSFSSAAWSSTSSPSYLSFQTTPSGSVTPSERMVIDASGNVGIGTTSPSYKLHVKGSIGVERSNQNDVSIIENEGNLTLKAATGGTGGNYNITFQTAGAEVARFNTSGNLGVNTILPAYKIDVTGDIRSTTSAYFATTSGNVGVGLASPRAKLDVVGNIITDWNDRFIGTQFGDGTQFRNGIITATATRETRIIAQGDATGNFISFYVGTTPDERARVTRDGELLINTTSDAGDYKLQVAGNQYISSRLVVGTTTDTGQTVQINSSLRLVPTSTVPTASAGTLYYDTATNKLKLYDGTSWVDLN